MQETRDTLLEPLRKKSQVDTLVTISHACHREWCQEEDERLNVRNYISIVAEALGLGTETDQLGAFKKTQDLEDILNRYERPGNRMGSVEIRHVNWRVSICDGGMAP